MGLAEQRISITGLFEPVAIAISTLRRTKVFESTEAHVLFTLCNGAAGIARSVFVLDDEEVEILVVDDAAGTAATQLVENLLETLDYKIQLVLDD